MMDASRWDVVKRLFEAALGQPAATRAAFVQTACGADDELRREVESLLVAHAEAGSFAEHPPVANGDRALLQPGARVGSYEIREFLAAGAMGEVYRAHDPQLRRDVALKVLPASFSTDPARVARFEREARLLAALNHPSIATIHGLEADRGTYALVLELVEGPTLADRLTKGPLPIQETLDIARQIAEALEAAHEKGIVHRDLKPANIKIEPAGSVKVLDFGLAKALVGEESGTDLSSLTMITVEGVVAGTPAYMSPEQATGQAVDKRTDIWAFGCLLFEMLTGSGAFRGETVSETLANVLTSEPRWLALPRETPASLRNIVRRCLEKDPRRRVHDMADVRLAMEGAFETAAALDVTAVAASRHRIWHRPAAAAIIASGITATVGLGIWTLTRPDPAAPVRLTVMPPAGETLGWPITGTEVAISPDGRRVVFITAKLPRFYLYVRALDQLEAQPLQVLGDFPQHLFMSPDGNWVGFFDEPDLLGKVALNGGPAARITNVKGGARGASWGADDTIVFATDDPATGLLRVPAAGGQAEVLTTPDAQKGELDHVFPELLPGGDAILFTIVPRTGGIDAAQIAVRDLRTGEQKILVAGGSSPRYVSTGHIVYGVAGTLRAVAFDLDRLEVQGNPVPVLQRVYMKPVGSASFGVSRDGSLVYLAGVFQGGAAVTLVWVDRQGREEVISAPPRVYRALRISPDGTRVAVQEAGDIWIWDFTRQALMRFTFDAAESDLPVWTPDGQRLVFSSEPGGSTHRLFWRLADGTGPVQQLMDNSSNDQYPTSFSPDGTRLLFTEYDSSTGFTIRVLPLKGDRTLASSTTLNGQNAEVSPDGRWLAYQSNESGQSEVYVRPFPQLDGGRWQVSTGGGTEPVWARSGKELFYEGLGGAMMSVAVDGGSAFRAGNPTRLFEWPYLVAAQRTYDVSPDGQRFLKIKPFGPQVAPTSLVVVQHWFEELKRLVPSR